MPVKNDREYRAMPVMAEMREEGAEPGYKVEGYASTFEPYLLFEEDGRKFYERIERGAYDGADMSDVLFLYNHEGQVMARQKNGSLQLTVDDGGLHVVADLGGSARGREMAEEIRSGLIDQMSFAFVVERDRIERDKDNGVVTRIIERMRKLYDVSAVSMPANPTTSISARSWVDGVIAEDEAERLQREAEEQEAREQAERREALLAGLRGLHHV